MPKTRLKKSKRGFDEQEKSPKDWAAKCWGARWRVEDLARFSGPREKGQALAQLAHDRGMVAAGLLLHSYNDHHNDDLLVCLNMLAAINAVEEGIDIDSPLSDAVLHLISALQ